MSGEDYKISNISMFKYTKRLFSMFKKLKINFAVRKNAVATRFKPNASQVRMSEQ